MIIKYPDLFSPIKIGNAMLKNRIIAAPMGVPRAAVISGTAYGGLSIYDKSLGGAAVITVSAYAVANIANEDNAFNKYAKDVTREVLTVMKQSGALACMEFSFHSQRFPDGTSHMPSDGIDPFGFMGKAMTKENMQEQIDNLCRDCVNAKNFGFDMIMLHFGHDSLASIFLSPVWNKRTDEYGGSLENRIRFAREAIMQVREVVGDDFPLMMRVSRHLKLEESYEEDDMMYFIREIHPYIDIVNISCGGDCYGGTSVEQYKVNTYAHTQAFDPRFYNIDFCARVKRELQDKILVAIVGGVANPEECERYISEGMIDLVMMGRQLVADPFWPQKALEGRDEDIVPCLRCTYCYHISTIHDNVQCSVNPRFRRENRVPLHLSPISEPQKVVVVGGGPAGMKAALTAGERGHRVILLEKEQNLGGQLKHSVYDKYKEDLYKYQEYLKIQLKKSDVEIRVGVEATPDYVSRLEPDYLIVAVGADFATPPIAGIEYAKPAAAIYPELQEIRSKTVVIGGGTVGCEVALQLAEIGNDVTLIEQKGILAENGNWLYRHSFHEHLRRCPNLVVKMNAAVKAVKDNGVTFLDEDGKESFIDAELVLYATGLNPRRDVAHAFFGITPNTVMVGDCSRVGNVVNATNDSYFVAANIPSKR